jgi:NADPH:quinone reductase-like Zn-dependent oxidoreductase
MKAARYHSYGSEDVIVYEDTDRPKAGPGQVVLRVAGAAFNPVDASIRGGNLTAAFPLALPHTPCYDVSGVVDEVGEGVTGWNIGDAAVGFLPIPTAGAAAEYAAVPVETLAAAPATIDLADAAAFPSVALTAWQALFEHAGLKADQSILINGAGGAVGGYAIQLAARAGANVTATASPRSRDRVKARGAAHVIDHTESPAWEAVGEQRFDVVLNLAWYENQDHVMKLIGLVADGGAYANTVPPTRENAERGVRTQGVFVRSDADQLAELVSQIDAGQLTIDVAQRRPLSELGAVHQQAASGTLPGKTVLVP